MCKHTRSHRIADHATKVMIPCAHCEHLNMLSVCLDRPAQECVCDNCFQSFMFIAFVTKNQLTKTSTDK